MNSSKSGRRTESEHWKYQLRFPRMKAPVISRLLFTTLKAIDNDTKPPESGSEASKQKNVDDIYKSPISRVRLIVLHLPQLGVYSPFAFLILSCLGHAATRVLVDIFLRLHAHSLLNSTQNVHLSVCLLKAFKWSLLLLFREGKAEFLLHWLIVAIVAKRWKWQKLKYGKKKNR